MKKTFIYLALAACIAVCNISCGSDDDGGSTNPGPSLPTPTYADKAAAFKINKDVVKDGAASLTAINFTESGKAFLEVTTALGAKEYAAYDAIISKDGSTYTIMSNNLVLGTVKSNATRGSKSATINIDITIYIGDAIYVFKTESADAQMEYESMTGGNALDNIARTWTVKNMKLTLESADPDFKSLSMTVQNGRLSDFVSEVKQRDTGFDSEDLDKLNKEIKSFTLDKTGLFTIEYSDGDVDAATWSWSGGNYSNIALNLKDSEMGNKFIQNNSKVTVDFNDNLCKFNLTTTLEREGKKPFVATLNIVLQPK